jgi:hypothetical protein
MHFLILPGRKFENFLPAASRENLKISLKASHTFSD